MAIKKYQTLNAFDFSNPIIANGYIPSGSISFIAYASNGCVCVPIELGVKYTISGIIRYSGSVVIRYGTSNAVPTSNTTLLRVGSFEQGETAEITAQSGENYLLIMFCGDSDYSAYGSVQSAYSANCANLHVDYSAWNTIGYKKYETATDTITSLPKTIIGDGQPISSWSMDGNMQVNGTPTPQNPITPAETGDKTANLSPVNTLTGTSSSVRTQFNTAFADMQYDEDTQYTISLNYTGNYGTNYGIFKVCFTHTDDTTKKSGWITTADVTDTLTSEVGKTVKSITITDFNNPVSESEMKNIMLNKGATALPYEPSGMYKIPILSNGNTYPIYLSEPIRKIGDSVDTAPSTGTATRNIYKLVLTGNEGWTQNGNYPQFYMSFSAPEYNVVTSASIVTTISSHFKGVPTGNVGTAYNICPRSNGSGLFISYGTLSNVTEFVTFLQQQYAAGTPVTVWYVLATATTETFTAPTLPTSGTAQSFDVSTTLKPSEVSLTWHGWHEHTDTKYSNP